MRPAVESEFLEWLARRSEEHNRQPNSRILVDIGDDGAMLMPPENCQLIVSDAIAEGTHFDLAQHSLDLVGRKALAVNLSDMAAMGAWPEFATVNFQLPKTFLLPDVIGLYLAMETLAAKYDTWIVGGDTNAWEGKLVVNVTLTGRLIAKQPWKLSDALPGDVIAVSGSFGGSRIEKHLNFTPRNFLAKQLAECCCVHAATDVSDSLSLDLRRLLAASRCGGEINLEAIPISKDVDPWIKISHSKRSRLEHALCDGEDFELIVTLSETEWSKLLANPDLAEQMTRIGTVCKKMGLVSSDGKPIEIRGYQH